ncbi:MAG: type III pantothenate kinase [Firmicutes bacterium]|nr:type III pantothenate kinase [Bacillota bacterium]
MRLLVVDAGNTQIKFGLFDDETLKYRWKITTAEKRTTDEFGFAILNMLHSETVEVGSIDRVAVCSVVPGIMHSLLEAIRRYLKKEPLLIGPGTKSGVKIRTANPREVGADLICDVAAAVEYYHAPCIIVDFGTVTKYEIVDTDGALMAAVFSPGIGISAEAMSSKAAQLPQIEIKKPKSIITSVTTECMQAGLVFGYIGQIKYIIEQIKQEMNLPDMCVIATGGFGKVFANEIDCLDYYDNALTLKGIRCIALKNKAPKKTDVQNE